ncbi:phage/plasmid primase, P4 family [Halobacteriota archaeon]
MSLERGLILDDAKAPTKEMKEWQKHPLDLEAIAHHPNIGIAGRDELVIIDADKQEMAKKLDEILPETYTVQSPRRKLPHKYFKVPGGVVPNRPLCVNQEDDEKAGEVRAQNHYVVAPGSKIKFIDLKTGKKTSGTYEVINDRPIAEIAFSDFFNAIQPYLYLGKEGKIDPKNIKGGVARGHRHDFAMRYATRLIRYEGLDRQTAFEWMLKWNQRCRPPIDNPTPDFERMIDNAIRYELRDQENDLPDTSPKEPITREYVGQSPLSELRAGIYNEKGKLDMNILSQNIRKAPPFICMVDNEELFHYCVGVYHHNGEAIVKRLCEEATFGDITNYEVNETIGHIKRSTQIERSEIDKDPYRVCVENGIFNLKTRELTPHTPDYVSLSKVPVTYDPDADCPEIKKFLSEVLNPQDISTIQELVGYCLWKEYIIAKAVMLKGSGRNGKGVLLNLLSAFLGHDNISNISLKSIVFNKWSLAELYGKLANISGDIDATPLKYLGEFLKSTGRDMLRAEVKFKGSFSFVNHAKMIFACNRLPKISDIEDFNTAYIERWDIIDFPNTFLDGDPKTDPHLIDKLTTPEELSGLLNYALDGLDRILQNKTIIKSKVADELKLTWIRETNTLLGFLSECTIYEKEGYITKDDFNTAYQNYCDRNELINLSKTQVTKTLNNDPKVLEFRPLVDGKQTRCWKGINFLDGSGYEEYNHKIDTPDDHNPPPPDGQSGLNGFVKLNPPIITIDVSQEDRIREFQRIENSKDYQRLTKGELFNVMVDLTFNSLYRGMKDPERVKETKDIIARDLFGYLKLVTYPKEFRHLNNNGKPELEGKPPDDKEKSNSNEEKTTDKDGQPLEQNNSNGKLSELIKKITPEVFSSNVWKSRVNQFKPRGDHTGNALNGCTGKDTDDFVKYCLEACPDISQYNEAKYRRLIIKEFIALRDGEA